MANIVAGTPAKKLEKIEQGIAIVANGNTHTAITTGQYVYVKGHSTLAEGMYTATAAIAENATLSSSNLTAASGGLNALKSSVDELNSNLVKTVKTVRMSIELDASGNWGTWNGSVGYENYQLIKAFPHTSWNKVTVYGERDGFWSIHVDGLVSQTVDMIMVIVYAPNPA